MLKKPQAELVPVQVLSQQGGQASQVLLTHHGAFAATLCGVAARLHVQASQQLVNAACCH